jgi:excinuclease ABC subunit A
LPKKYAISLTTPIEKLSKEHLDLLLFGDKNITADFELNLNDENIPDAYTGSYEGIIPMLKRWFMSSNSSDFLKSWVEKFTTQCVCNNCHGKLD